MSIRMKQGFCMVRILSQIWCIKHSRTAAKKAVLKCLELQMANKRLAAFNKLVRTGAKKMKIGGKMWITPGTQRLRKWEG